MGLVTVCDKCMRASCWQGEFYCEDYKSAGTVEVGVDTLYLMDLEDPTYWEITPDEQAALAEKYGRL